MREQKTDRKPRLYAELAFVLGIVILALGTALMEKADFGMSMVVAPAYLLHLKLSQTFSWFSFGMAEYCLQAFLLVLLAMILRRFKVTYLCSFLTAVFYGFVLDFLMYIVSFLQGASIPWRVGYYVVGLLFCAIGVALLFNTYLAPEAYELLVKEVSATFHSDIAKTKTIYDCTSCFVAIIMSFAFFGLWHFEGVKLGTVLCALINGFIIGKCNQFMQAKFEILDAFSWRSFFQK